MTSIASTASVDQYSYDGPCEICSMGYFAL